MNGFRAVVRGAAGVWLALALVACGDAESGAAVGSAGPVADAGGPYAGTVGSPVGFQGTGSTDPEDPAPLTFSWEFGDGATGSGPTPAHAYQTAGTYTASLVVTGPGDPSKPDHAVVEVTDSGAVTLVGAGDIATCGGGGDEATAKLLDDIPGTVFTIGDNIYPSGKPEDFARCYDATWGRHKDRTRPNPGNHDYRTAGATGYFDYFGSAAGESGRGYYSYDIGAWHVVTLNSNADVTPESPQVKWLREDLAASTSLCTLAYWHHPLFSSGAEHGNQPFVKPLWDVLYQYGAELVLGGHDHTYERFAPQDPDGMADPVTGIREFVVGTGGGSLYSFSSPEPNSEVRYDGDYGVLKLTLSPSGYAWEFIPVSGPPEDVGTGVCHPAPRGDVR